MDLGSANGIRGLIGPGREQWMREADAVALELDDARLECGRQPLVTRHPGRGLDDRDGRLRVGGGSEQEVAAFGRQGEQTAVDEVAE